MLEFHYMGIKCSPRHLQLVLDLLMGGANLYSARTFKIKEDEDLRTYYYYEFGIAEQHVALVAAVNCGKAYIAGAAAPSSKWDKDGVKLRSSSISFSV